MTVDELLAQHQPAVREVVEHLRALLARQMPEAEEKVYPGWHAIGYRHPKAGYVCGIFPQSDHVRLLFEYGALLPDPVGMLRGETRQVRWVPLWDWKPELEEPLAELLDMVLVLRG